jgi:subfamily B ATP-binding cassette protein HlyB/CyaB
MAVQRVRVSAETLVWGLSAAAQLNRIPFDPKLLLQQFPPPYTLESLHEAAGSLGLKVGLRPASVADLAHTALPCLAVLMPDPQAEAGPAALPDAPKVTPLPGTARPSREAPDGPPPHRLVLVVQATPEAVSFFQAGSASVTTLDSAAFAQAFAGQLLLFTRRPAQAGAQQADQDAPRRFGFSWFVPELLKHRKIWRDVLIASAAIQLMALATPIFTQVIIDNTPRVPSAAPSAACCGVG